MCAEVKVVENLHFSTRVSEIVGNTFILYVD